MSPKTLSGATLLALAKACVDFIKSSDCLAVKPRVCVNNPTNFVESDRIKLNTNDLESYTIYPIIINVIIMVTTVTIFIINNIIIDMLIIILFLMLLRRLLL